MLNKLENYFYDLADGRINFIASTQLDAVAKLNANLRTHQIAEINAQPLMISRPGLLDCWEKLNAINKVAIYALFDWASRLLNTEKRYYVIGH